MATGALTEQVAEELEQAAVATRQIDSKAMGTLFMGMGIGVAIGFYLGYKYSKRKLRKEIYEETEKEIAEMREHYRIKTLAVEAQDKPDVEDLVKERGYDTTEGPELKIEYARLDDPAEPRPLPPPVPVDPPRSAVRGMPIPEEEDKTPHVIPEEEFTFNESGYSQVSYTYYLTDNVLVDDADPTTMLSNRENLIGDEALDRFGYGSDDPNIVHVRNPKLQMEFEISRDPGSWERDVLGLDDNESN